MSKLLINEQRKVDTFMKSGKLVALLTLALSLGMLLSLTSFTSGAFAQSATSAKTKPADHSIALIVKTKSASFQSNQKINKQEIEHLNITIPRYTVNIKKLTIINARGAMPAMSKMMPMHHEDEDMDKAMPMPHQAMSIMPQATTPNISLKITHPTINITINIYNPHYDFDLDVKHLNIASPFQLQLQR